MVFVMRFLLTDHCHCFSCVPEFSVEAGEFNGHLFLFSFAFRFFVDRPFSLRRSTWGSSSSSSLSLFLFSFPII